MRQAAVNTLDWWTAETAKRVGVSVGGPQSCPMATETSKCSSLSAEVGQACVRLLGLIRAFGFVVFV